MDLGQSTAIRAVRSAAALILALTVAFVSTPADAQNRIGNAVQIVQVVTGEIAADVRYLVLRDPVFQDEVIATKPASASRIVFEDDTELQVGPDARITLDSFVFDPDPSIARFVISAFEGIFRFSSGSLTKTAYAIETPSAVIGVRGTTFVSVFGPAGENVIILEDGTGVTVRNRNGGPLRNLDQAGLSVTIETDGAVSDPAPPPQWALDKLQELNALLFTLNQLIINDDPFNDDFEPTIEAAVAPPPPPPVVVVPPPPAPVAVEPPPPPKQKPPKKDKPRAKAPHPKPPAAKPPRKDKKKRAHDRAHEVAAQPARDGGLKHARERADVRAEGRAFHPQPREDIRIERRGRRHDFSREVRSDDDRPRDHATRDSRLEARAAPGRSSHDGASRGDGRRDRDHERSDRRGGHDRDHAARDHDARDHDSSARSHDRGDRGRDRSDRDHGRGDRGHDRGDRDYGRGDRGHDRADRDHGRGDRGHDRGDREHASRDHGRGDHGHGGHGRGGRGRR